MLRSEKEEQPWRNHKLHLSKILKCSFQNSMCFFSKTISSLHYLWPVCSGTQIGGWNAKPQLSVSSSQPSRRNPLTTPLASRSLHHLSLLGIMITSPGTGSQALARSQKVKPRREREIWNPSDMIFVKMFTLANFGPVMFYPKAHNSLESTEA